MGDGADSCCWSCEKWAGKTPDAIEREPMEGAPSQFKVVVRDCRGQIVRELAPTGPKMVIGRAADVEISLNSCTLSRKNSQLVFEDDAVYAEDLNSTCGTFVDGAMVQRARLGEGSVVGLGEYVLSVTRVR